MRRFRSLLLLCAGVLTATVAVGSATAANPVPVSILISENTNPAGTGAAGVFTATIGPVSVSGTSSQQWVVKGNSIHCTHTLVTAKGTLVLRSDCNLVTAIGAWHVVGGTGAFANFRAYGTLVFLPATPAYDSIELLKGIAP